MLKIVLKKTKTLKLNKDNTRTHSKAQLKQLANSMQEFGFTNPILVDKKYNIIAGHGRFFAAELLGLENVPVIVLKDLTKIQQRAYAIADNQLALNAGWDKQLLSNEVLDLKKLDFDLNIIGFSLTDLNRLFDMRNNKGLIDEDNELIELKKNVVTKTDDIWKLGKHTLICGDATQSKTFELLLKTKKAVICITSPPYNFKGNKGKDKRNKKKYIIDGDNKNNSDYLAFLTKNTTLLLKHSTEIFYNMGITQGNKIIIIEFLGHFKESFKDFIYWKKTQVEPRVEPGVLNDAVELIICLGNSNNRKFKNAQFAQGTFLNVIEGSNASNNEFHKIHKATFPVYLPETLLLNFSPRFGLVLDCFAGTGTTLIACEKNNRIAALIEMEPIYCDVIVRRWQQYTGKTAINTRDKRIKIK